MKKRSYAERCRLYEAEKAELAKKNLRPEEYEAEIKGTGEEVEDLSKSFEDGIGGYIHAQAMVDIYFPVDKRGWPMLFPVLFLPQELRYLRP